MHLLPGPKTKLSNTLSGPLFQQVLSTRETRSRRCSVRVVEFRLSLPGTVSVSLNLWFFFVCDGSFYHRLNLLWLAFRSSNFFFVLKTFSLCFADVVRVKKTIIIAEENNLNRNWPRYARAKPNRKLRFWHRFRVPPHSLTSSNMGDKQQRSGGCFLVLSFFSFCTNNNYLALNFDLFGTGPGPPSADFRPAFVFQGGGAQRETKQLHKLSVFVLFVGYN